MRISVDERRIRNNKVAFFKYIRHSVDGALKRMTIQHRSKYWLSLLNSCSIFDIVG